MNWIKRNSISRLVLWLKWVAGFFVAFLLIVICIPLPDPLFDKPYATPLFSNEGVLLSASIADDEQWRFPPTDSLPAKFEIALRLFEDEYFHYHPGVNPWSLARAAKHNYIQGRVVSGGSTLTMQTVRIAYDNPPRTYLQKLVEILRAFKLELLYSKSFILKSYAAHAPFGGNTVGLQAASWRYYGRAPYELSWAEAAALAILPNDPAAVFPGKNQDRFRKKRDRLLRKIHTRGYLTEDELFLAIEEPLPEKFQELPNQAYHLLHRSTSEGMKNQNVQTTINARLQYAASRMVNSYSSKLANNQIHNAAAVILDIESGHTLAYVGNTNNPGDHGQHVDIITSKRSPGSLLKPFLYAAALDEGLITPKQLLPDVPVFYKGFAPKNFDKQFRGAVHADDALISSLNVPFVHLLIEYGYEKFHQKLLTMGFHSIDKPASHYGLSIILGGAETSLWEITAAYAGMVRAMRNYGARPYKASYAKEDYRDNFYLKDQGEVSEARLETDGYLRAPSIKFVLEAMQKVERPASEAGWKHFASTKSIAWKTGTSYGFRDAWAIGINENYLVGVWVGNADGEGRPGLTGVSAAAPLLFDLFDLVKGKPMPLLTYGNSIDICHDSGMIASSDCPNTFKSGLPDYLLQAGHCQYHKILHLDATSTYQVNSSCYDISLMKNEPWFVLPPVQAWYYKKFKPNFKVLPPYKESCIQSKSNNVLDLIYPGQFTKIKIPKDQTGKQWHAIFEAAHDNRKATLYWHIDGVYLGQTTHAHKKAIKADPGVHTLTLVDEHGNEVIQEFEVIQ